MKTIKRYKNRRLYDTESSRTITQFELARMIREGRQVRVIDSTTGEDITRDVLGRVLLAEAERWGSVSEVREMLRSLIYLGGDKSMSVLKNTILASIGAIQVTKEKAEKLIDELIKKGELDKSSRKKAVMELLDKADKTTADFRKKITTEAEKAKKSAEKFAGEIAWARQQDFKKLESKVTRLAKRVKELEKQV